MQESADSVFFDANDSVPEKKEDKKVVTWGYLIINSIEMWLIYKNIEDLASK